MQHSMRATGPIRLLIGTALAVTLLAGCGSESASGDLEPTEPVGTPTSSTPNTPTATSTPTAQAGTLPVPAGGPTAITEFPVPAGAEIVDAGPPLEGNWQFGISSPDTATTLEFYRTALAAAGYALREDVAVVVGANTISYDLAFFGPTFGIVDENELLGGTLVTVDDSPLNGLEP